MRLVLVISSLEGGGAERVMTNLANGWAARGEHVHIITLRQSRQTHYPLDSRVTCDSLPSSRSPIPPIRVWNRVRRLRAQFKRLKPDAILSFGDRTNVQALLAARGLRIPVVVSERVDPERAQLSSGWNLLRRWTYPSATTLAVQTKTVQRWARRWFPNLQTMVIPNPVLNAESEATVRDNTIVAAGRLVPQKGLDLLIRAFSMVADRHPGWSLEIFGEGPLRGELETLVARLGLQDRIRLPGFCTNLKSRLRTAGLFVLPSRFEGFPNALVEAMAHGNAVLAANCPSGPDEIIRDGADGRLVPPEDAESLAAAINELLSSPAERERFGAAARAVKTRFRLTHVLDLWEEAFSRHARDCQPGEPVGEAA